MNLEELLTALKTLSKEDKQKAWNALETVADESNIVAEETTETITEEGLDLPTPETETLSEEVKESEGGKEGIGTEDGTEAVADEPIPDIEISGQSQNSGFEQPQATDVQTEPPLSREQAPPILDEEGAEMPVDYQQIIDGLNAKNLALETENKQLKSKMDGAFGLTGRPGGFAAVNPLYNDTADIPKMRK